MVILFERMRMKILKRTYAVAGLINIVAVVGFVISMILVVGMVGTDDFYTIELKQVIPPFPTYVLVQPYIMVVTGLVLIVTQKLREVIEDVYRERRREIKRRQRERRTPGRRVI